MGIFSDLMKLPDLAKRVAEQLPTNSEESSQNSSKRRKTDCDPNTSTQQSGAARLRTQTDNAVAPASPLDKKDSHAEKVVGARIAGEEGKTLNNIGSSHPTTDSTRQESKTTGLLNIRQETAGVAQQPPPQKTVIGDETRRPPTIARTVLNASTARPQTPAQSAFSKNRKSLAKVAPAAQRTKNEESGKTRLRTWSHRAGDLPVEGGDIILTARSDMVGDDNNSEDWTLAHSIYGPVSVKDRVAIVVAVFAGYCVVVWLGSRGDQGADGLLAGEHERFPHAVATKSDLDKIAESGLLQIFLGVALNMPNVSLIDLSIATSVKYERHAKKLGSMPGGSFLELLARTQSPRSFLYDTNTQIADTVKHLKRRSRSVRETETIPSEVTENNRNVKRLQRERRSIVEARSDQPFDAPASTGRKAESSPVAPASHRTGSKVQKQLDRERQSHPTLQARTQHVTNGTPTTNGPQTARTVDQSLASKANKIGLKSTASQ